MGALKIILKERMKEKIKRIIFFFLGLICGFLVMFFWVPNGLRISLELLKMLPQVRISSGNVSMFVFALPFIFTFFGFRRLWKESRAFTVGWLLGLLVSVISAVILVYSVA